MDLVGVEGQAEVGPQVRETSSQTCVRVGRKKSGRSRGSRRGSRFIQAKAEKRKRRIFKWGGGG